MSAGSSSNYAHLDWFTLTPGQPGALMHTLLSGNLAPSHGGYTTGVTPRTVRTLSSGRRCRGGTGSSPASSPEAGGTHHNKESAVGRLDDGSSEKGRPGGLFSPLKGSNVSGRTTKMTEDNGDSSRSAHFRMCRAQRQDMKAMGHAGGRQLLRTTTTNCSSGPQRRTHNKRQGGPARTKWRWKVVRRGGGSDEI